MAAKDSDRKLVTIYTRGQMGVCKVEARLVEHGRRKYAQYDAAPFARFVPKGKRNERGIVEAEHRPSLLILGGHGHPDPDGLFGPEEVTATGAVVSRSRYRSCDPRWQSDFDRKIGEYLARTGAEVVADYRPATADLDEEAA